MSRARLFWVVISPEDNEEIFETQEQAEEYAKAFSKQEPYSISIAEVKNYFQEPSGAWNYEDLADTFGGFSFTITVQNDTRPVSTK